MCTKFSPFCVFDATHLGRIYYSGVLYFTGENYWMKPLYGVTAPEYPRHLLHSDSPFRDLPVTSFDDAVFTSAAGNYVNYIFSGNEVFEIDVRTGAVSL